MRTVLALGIAAFAFAGARVARTAANTREEVRASVPYAPSPRAAPFMALGYREAAADLLFVRLRGYFGGIKSDPIAIAELCEAVVELDPRFRRMYEYCGHAMSYARPGIPQPIYLRAIKLLERGALAFPEDWRIPNLAGQIYTQDLVTDDPALRRTWDEKGTLLVESAIRKPGAPAQLQEWAAVMRTKFGQHQRAVQGLREMLLLTTDIKARGALLQRLADLEEQNADQIAGELYEARKQFDELWIEHRPVLSPTWFILLGPRLGPGFDLEDLATGGRDLLADSAPTRDDPVPD